MSSNFKIAAEDSNEYTQYIIFNIKRKSLQIILNLQMGIFSKELKNDFETAVVNGPSVFEPLKFYCSCRQNPSHFIKFYLHTMC